MLSAAHSGSPRVSFRPLLFRRQRFLHSVCHRSCLNLTLRCLPNQLCLGARATGRSRRARALLGRAVPQHHPWHRRACQRTHQPRAPTNRGCRRRARASSSGDRLCLTSARAAQAEVGSSDHSRVWLRKNFCHRRARGCARHGLVERLDLCSASREHVVATCGSIQLARCAPL
jgi:hypothetical protein